MGQIMEFLLNLLLLRGKFLTTTAAETVHEAIRMCLRFKRQIHSECINRTQVITPFDNMMEFVNYNSSLYKCEQCDGKSFVIASQVHCDLHKYLNQTEKKNSQNLHKDDHEQIEARASKAKEASGNGGAIPGNLLSEQAKPEKEKQNFYEDHIIENLHAILKSQECLFQNIIKLVSVMEKQEIVSKNSTKLQKLKEKSAACKDILSNSSPPQLFSNIINNIIEDEITRCRFRHGGRRTSAEINLNLPHPQGIEIVLAAPQAKTCLTNRTKMSEKRHIHAEKSKLSKMGEEKRSSEKSSKTVATSSEEVVATSPLKSPTPPKTDPAVIQRNKSSQTIAEIEDTKKLIDVNQGQFNKFENRLWHSLTTLKCLSLKGEYVNLCKCAFSNKRQFAATELAITKRMREEADRKHFQKVIDISNAMFQNLERNLLFETVKEEMCRIDRFPVEIRRMKALSGKVDLKEKNPFVELLEQNQKFEVQALQNQISAEIRSEVKNEGRKLNGPPANEELEEATSSKPEETVTKELEDTKTNNQKTSEKSFKSQDANTVINGNVLLKLSSSWSESAPREKPSQRGVSTDAKNENSEKQGKGSDVEEKGKDEVEFAEKHLYESPEKIKVDSTTAQILENGASKISSIGRKGVQVKKAVSESSIKEDKPRQSSSETTSLTNMKSKEDISKVPDIPPQNGGQVSQKIKDTQSSEHEAVEKDQSKIYVEESYGSEIGRNTQRMITEEISVEAVKKRSKLATDLENKPEASKKMTQDFRKSEEKGVEPVKERSKITDLENKPQATINDWKRILDHISELNKKKTVNKKEETEDTESKIVMRKESPEMQEKRAMSEILERHTGIVSSSVLEDETFEARIEEIVARTQSLEDKIASLSSSTVVNGPEKLGSVSTQEMENEANRIKVSEKAFKDLEKTVRAVPVFSDKESKRSGQIIKTTIENKRRKVDEPAKKNMSTRHHSCTTKQRFLTHKTTPAPIKTSAEMAHSARDRHFLFKEVQKQTLPHNKTFLKNSTWQKSKLRSGQISDDEKHLHSLAQSVGVEESKSKSQMRRTTKNAMKRQQVITIYPKASKTREEKKKSKVSLIAAEEMEASKANKTEECPGSEHQMRFCSVNKIVGTRKTFSASLLKEVVHKTLSGTFRSIKWEDEDDEIVRVFKC